jgi:hypothetical protein
MGDGPSSAGQLEPLYYTPRRKVLEPLQPQRTQFADVLARLAADKAYRDQATKDPDLIANDYKLTLQELSSLRQVAILSGADTTQVSRVRAVEFAARAEGGGVADWSVSCCSCCCCCCGETAVAPVIFAR